MYFYCYDYVFFLYFYVCLPWLRFFRAFSSVVRQMPGQNPQIRSTARTLPDFCVVLCIFLFYVVLCIVCVYMCTVLLPPGGYPIAVNKYIISYTLHVSTPFTCVFSTILTNTVWTTMISLCNENGVCFLWDRNSNFVYNLHRCQSCNNVL